MKARVTAAFAALVMLLPARASAEVTFALSIAIAGEAASPKTPVASDAWVDAQIEEANRLFVPFGTRFRWSLVKDLPEPHGEMHSRADRDRLTPLGEGDVIDVFVVRELEDVDEPGRARMGVCWTGLGGRRFIILSRIAKVGVLAHELGHFFGNPHSRVPNNVMSYERDGTTPPFFDAVQAARIRRFSADFLGSRRLRDIGPPRRIW